MGLIMVNAKAYCFDLFDYSRDTLKDEIIENH